MDIKKIMKSILNRGKIYRLCFMMLGTFLLALTYNMFLVRNNFVTGGVSGLAIVFHSLFGWSNQVFIYIANFILLIISFITLGYKKTKNSIIGSILYPLMITFTLPLSELLVPYFTFDDFFLTLAITSILYGFSNGLVYKMGYTTGGSDIIMNIMVKYLHMSEGKANFISSVIIILFAGIVIDTKVVIYAIIITYVLSIIVDRMMLGISKSKLFFIETSKVDKVMHVIINDLHLGATLLKAEGGYSNKKRDIIMAAISTKDYIMFKEIILTIDPEAFFIINDCYDMAGGTINNKSILDTI